jgi:hypothetical protein
MNKMLLPVLLLMAGQVFAAGGVNDMYSRAALVKSKVRYEQRVGQLFTSGLRDYMNRAEKQALSGVRIELPLKGGSPLDVYSHAISGVPTVVFPVLSLKFIEDLSVAYAWRHVNRYSLEPIDEYLAMLKYRRPKDFPGARIPDPLTALGVPPRIWERDKKVDDLSLRFRNTAWAFILAHELGHLRFRHPGNKQVRPEVSQRNEEEADAFAVKLLSRSDTIPMGMILWFQASVGYFKNRADFNTETEYRKWVQKKATHPVNPERLQRLAVVLDGTAGASLSPKHTEIVQFIAGKLVNIGDILADPDMQRLIARCAVLGRPEDLKRLHGRPCDERLK